MKPMNLLFKFGCAFGTYGFQIFGNVLPVIQNGAVERSASIVNGIDISAGFDQRFNRP